MRITIVGGGMAGLVLAQALARRGHSPLILERGPADQRIPGPIMLPFQGYDALSDIGLLDRLRQSGRDIPPHRDGVPVSISAARQTVIEALREGLQIAHGHELIDLVREGDRVAGVRVRAPDGERTIASDVVVGADGTGSAVRRLAQFPAAVTPCDTAQLSWRSPVHLAEAFHIDFLADGRQITALDWADGSAGGWQIVRPAGGRQEAMAPGWDAYRRAFATLLPAAREALEGVSDPETQWFYREVYEVRCERWWAPGVTLIGESLHAMNPEAGIGSGLGMGDALALAIAIERHPDDPDAALGDYERWRRPALAPYLAVGSQGVRVMTGRPARPEERWPPQS